MSAAADALTTGTDIAMITDDDPLQIDSNVKCIAIPTMRTIAKTQRTLMSFVEEPGLYMDKNINYRAIEQNNNENVKSESAGSLKRTTLIDNKL